MAKSCRSDFGASRLFRIGDLGPRDDQLVVPGVGDWIRHGRVFTGMVGKQPDFAVQLAGRAVGVRGEVVRPPVEDLYRRLPFTGDPQVYVAVLKLPIHPRAEYDVLLEGHPFIREVGEAVSRRRKIARRAGVPLRVEAEGRRHGILQLEVTGAVRLLERIVGAVGGRTGAGVVHLREAALEGVLDDQLQSRTGTEAIGRIGRSAPGLVAGPGYVLLPTAATGVDVCKQGGREPLTPLYIELLASAELH